MTIGLVAGTLTLAAKPSALDLSAQTGKGAKVFSLKGKHSRQQLVATATDAGKLSDVSRKVKYSATPAKVVAINATGMVTPLGDGEATITATHAGGLKATPDNPRGSRSKSLENRCKGRGEWNVYDVVCVDGVVKLSVNGKFVNGIRNVQYKKGYLCLESEGAEIHFRNLKIMELPPGITSPEQTAPLVK